MLIANKTKYWRCFDKICNKTSNHFNFSIKLPKSLAL